MANITYIVTGDANDLDGWTPEMLAAALREPLAALGVEVVCKPHQSGGGGLIDQSDALWSDAEDRRSAVASLVERIISG